MKIRIVIPGVLLASLFATVFLWRGTAVDGVDARGPAQLDLAAGKALYAEACAACHGANLEGQDNWRTPDEDGRLPAPPHDETGHTWHHGDQVLFEYTRLGGREMMASQGVAFESGMPGFGDHLTDREIWSILEYIKSTWPEHIRDMQAARTADEARKGGD